MRRHKLSKIVLIDETVIKQLIAVNSKWQIEEKLADMA